MAQYAIEVYR